MPVFDTKANPAICVLPWVHEFKKINGKMAPCCSGDSFKDNETIEQTTHPTVTPNECRWTHKIK